MPILLRTRFFSPLTNVALAISLLANTSPLAAQGAPPPAPRQIIQAPPPAAAQPSNAAAPAAPPAAPAQQGYPPAAAYPQQPQQGAYPQTYQAPPQQGAYPQTYQAPPQGAYPQNYQAPPTTQQPLYQPQPAQPTVWRPPAPRRPSKGLMITGISILGGTYLLSMAVGAALLDDDDDDYEDDYDNCPNCRDVGPWLFLPLAGPFVAMSQTRDGDWGLWFLGMLQVVGTGLMTGGIIKYKNSKRAADMQGYSWNLPHDRKLTFDVASNARFSGPRLRLDF